MGGHPVRFGFGVKGRSDLVVCCKKESWARYGLSILGGLMLAASFPKPGIAGLAWFAPGLLLAAAAGTSGGTAFRLGYAGGMAHFLASLYWLLFIPVPIAPIVGWLALSGFLALYAGFWVWLCWMVFPRRFGPRRAEEGHQVAAAGLPVRQLVSEFATTPWWQRLVWAVACAALWAAWEMTQARFLTGFPWNFLGASQYRMLPLIQVASITGVYGVSFLVVWSSVALLGAAAALIYRPQSSWLWRREFFLVLFAAVGWAFIGQAAIRGQAGRPDRVVKMALVQPSIPQTVIWDQDEETEAQRFRQLLELSRRALEAHPEVVVWPEAAVPTLFRWSTNAIYQGQTVYQAITTLAREHGVWMVIGADDAELNQQNQREFFNSSFLISPEGRILATYRKQRLVMFGEYVPLSRTFPFLKRFTQVYGEFKPGQAPVKFELNGMKTSVLICFEDVFPHLARRHVEADVDFLLNLTNNGWFGESAAQWQHAAAAALRAVENGLPLVRAANNGLSCWVDRDGAMYDVYFPDGKDIYQAGFKIAAVPLVAGPRRPTFYNRHGDVFGWGCVGASVLLVGASGLRSFRSRRH